MASRNADWHRLISSEEYLLRMPGLPTNPYAPPADPGGTRPADWYLNSACRHLTWTGWLGMAWVAFAISVMLFDLLFGTTPRNAVTVYSVWFAFVLFIAQFFVAVIRTAMQLPGDFERLRKRARWLGILAGAIGFPILTVPAFIGIARLARYGELTQRQDGGSPG